MEIPNECPRIESRLDGKKAYCSLWRRWTNCLEAGHCTYETIAGRQELPETEEDTCNGR